MKNCPLCNGNITISKKDEEFKYNNRSLIIKDYQFFHCTQCGESFIDEEYCRNSGINDRLKIFMKECRDGK